MFTSEMSLGLSTPYFVILVMKVQLHQVLKCGITETNNSCFKESKSSVPSLICHTSTVNGESLYFTHNRQKWPKIRVSIAIVRT